LAKAKIGNNNVIAPGAFVYKGCRDGCLMAGNPALDVSGERI
jgi:acetyltransferase-like isoleucine patch superfamily enzyme